MEKLDKVELRKKVNDIFKTSKSLTEAKNKIIDILHEPPTLEDQLPHKSGIENFPSFFKYYTGYAKYYGWNWDGKNWWRYGPAGSQGLEIMDPKEMFRKCEDFMSKQLMDEKLFDIHNP